MLSALNRVLNHLEEWLIAFLIACATLLIFVAVAQRYSTSLSINGSKWAAAHGFTVLAAVLASIFDWCRSWDLSWSQEVCVIMFVWMAKFGAAYGVRTGVHVGVDVATNAISSTSRYWVVLFGLACGAIFTFTIGTLGVSMVYHVWQRGTVFDNVDVPQWIAYLAIPLGTYLMCLRFVQVFYAFSRTGNLPHTDESHVDGLETVVPTTPDVSGAPAMAGGVR